MPRLRVSPGSCCSSRPFPLGDHSPGGSAQGGGFGGPKSPLRSFPLIPSRVNCRCPALGARPCPFPAGTLPVGSALSPLDFPSQLRGRVWGSPTKGLGAGQVLAPSPAPGAGGVPEVPGAEPGSVPAALLTFLSFLLHAASQGLGRPRPSSSPTPASLLGADCACDPKTEETNRGKRPHPPRGPPATDSARS